MALPPISRRALLGGAGASVAAAAGGFALGRADDDQPTQAATVAFHGPHQSGIVTPAQDRLHFAAFDLTTNRREDLRDLFQAWTRAASLMTQGRSTASSDEVALAPPEDTGEAEGLPASRLTITFGFGPTLFDRRFGLAEQRPAALREIPALPGDTLDRRRCGGDLCIQACAEDPQVVFHAVRNLARIARGTAILRWSQLGFGRTSATTRAQTTPRNLMGFKDGTNNLRAEDGAALDEHVWIGAGAGERAWTPGGTYLVVRRIRMLIEAWDRAPLQDQELTIGRRKRSGAPLGGSDEFAPVDVRRLPSTSHVRLAQPAANAGARLLRRGYSFTDGMDFERGQLDAGLFFISFQRDPQAFVDLQRRLGGRDALNEYIEHTGSGVFLVPPGIPAGGWVGQTLLA